MSNTICKIEDGINMEDADAAQLELMEWVRQNRPHLLHDVFKRPFYGLNHTASTKIIADSYCAVSLSRLNSEEAFLNMEL